MRTALPYHKPGSPRSAKSPRSRRTSPQLFTEQQKDRNLNDPPPAILVPSVGAVKASLLPVTGRLGYRRRRTRRQCGPGCERVARVGARQPPAKQHSQQHIHRGPEPAPNKACCRTSTDPSTVLLIAATNRLPLFCPSSTLTKRPDVAPGVPEQPRTAATGGHKTPTTRHRTHSTPTHPVHETPLDASGSDEIGAVTALRGVSCPHRGWLGRGIRKTAPTVSWSSLLGR